MKYESVVEELMTGVVCLKTDERGQPCYIINPIFQLHISSRTNMGDYDRIVLDVSGIWHWEHSEYYPEYYSGHPDYSTDYGNYDDIDEIVPPDDDPVSGEVVNSDVTVILHS